MYRQEFKNQGNAELLFQFNRKLPAAQGLFIGDICAVRTAQTDLTALCGHFFMRFLHILERMFCGKRARLWSFG